MGRLDARGLEIKKSGRWGAGKTYDTEHSGNSVALGGKAGARARPGTGKDVCDRRILCSVLPCTRCILSYILSHIRNSGAGLLLSKTCTIALYPQTLCLFYPFGAATFLATDIEEGPGQGTNGWRTHAIRQAILLLFLPVSVLRLSSTAAQLRMSRLPAHKKSVSTPDF